MGAGGYPEVQKMPPALRELTRDLLDSAHLGGEQRVLNCAPFALRQRCLPPWGLWAQPFPMSLPRILCSESLSSGHIFGL